MTIQKNKGLTMLTFVLFILLVTNPSNSDFKEYLMAKGNSKEYVDNVGGKTLNFFIFSVFEINYQRAGKIPLVYRSIGVLENFIVINDYREEFEKVQ